MKTLKTSLLLAFIVLNISFQAQNTTPTVKIGNQEWMINNLNVETFRNGDTITEAQSYEKWLEASEKRQPAWCYQVNLPNNGQKYGKLYNWYAVNDPRGIAPKGYHVPTRAEWDSLVAYLGGEEIAGKKLKSTEGWLVDEDEDGNSIGSNGTNESGFLGLPVGNRNGNSHFANVGYNTFFWSSTEENSYYALYANLNYLIDEVTMSKDYKAEGLSVRCLKD